MSPRHRKTKYTRGRWMIERERCGIPAGTPPPAELVCADMEAGVQDVFANLGLTEVAWTAQLVEEWAGIVGAQLALHTRPGRMNGNKLVVYVDSSVWLHELNRYGLKGMYEKVQQHCGRSKVGGIQLQLDPDLRS
ncbi:MAG: DUF721 domain-containing protein [Kiritimatiellia bacterium]